MKKLLYIAIQTPDGTILPSFHRHDYRDYTDKNGIYYMIDGGPNSGYIRHSGDGQEKWIQVFSDDPFEKIRKFLHWGRNYDENMNRLFETQWIPICELNDGHLDALIDYPRISEFHKVMFIQEKLHRAEQEYEDNE